MEVGKNMKNILLKKSWCLGAIIILIAMSTIPISIGMSENNISLKPTIKPGDNILANVSVYWLRGLNIPDVICENTDDKVFVFPEDSEGRVKLNFTFNWKHKFEKAVSIPIRLTHVEFSIQNETDYIYQLPWFKWKPTLESCTSVDWEEFTIYKDQNDYGVDLGWHVPYIQTSGSDVPLEATVVVAGMFPFRFMFKGVYFVDTWNIIIRPLSD